MANVIVVNQVSTIVAVAKQGLPGPQGIPGPAGSTTFQAIAGETMGSNRVSILIFGQAFYASKDNASYVNRVVGITTNAVNAGALINLQNAGEMTGLSGLIADQPIYLDVNGTMTQTVPIAGFVQQVGIALSNTSMLINIQPALKLLL